MKWFKHMTNSRNNKNIQAIVGRYGLPGVTRYFWLLEMIAEQMTDLDPDRSFYTFRPGYITRSLAFRSANDCQSFLEWLANDRGMIGFTSGNEWVVRCDKLLIIKARKNLIGSKKTSLDIDIDKDIEHIHGKKQKPAAKAASAAPRQDSFVSRVQKYFLEKWEAKYQAKYNGFSWAQSGALIKRLQTDSSAPPDKLLSCIDRYMDCDDPFILESRHNFSVFYKTINRWMVSAVKKESAMDKVFREMKEEQERKANDIR